MNRCRADGRGAQRDGEHKQNLRSCSLRTRGRGVVRRQTGHVVRGWGQAGVWWGDWPGRW